MPSANPLTSPLRAGIGGWQYAPWRGSFYPSGLTQKNELAHASRALGTIEINSTFYRPATPASYAAWREATPEGFVFSLKAPRQITQQRRLAHTGEAITQFVQGGLAELGDRLGPVVWQFGPYKSFDSADLTDFLALLPTAVNGLPLRHVLEVRHASFMNPSFLALVRAHGVSLVGTDSDEHPSFFDLSGDLVYLRLMRCRAEEPTGYPADELSTWRAHAHTWAQGDEPAGLPRIAAAASATGRPRQVFVLFINGAKERAPMAAQAFQRAAAPELAPA
jgi:uncharacterized protein YecE (DUF72 family)